MLSIIGSNRPTLTAQAMSVPPSATRSLLRSRVRRGVSYRR